MSNQPLWENVYIHRNHGFGGAPQATKTYCQQNLVSSLHIHLIFDRIWRIFSVYTVLGQLLINCYFIQGHKVQLAMITCYNFDFYYIIGTCIWIWYAQLITRAMCFLVNYNIQKFFSLSLKVFIKLQFFSSFRIFFSSSFEPSYVF